MGGFDSLVKQKSVVHVSTGMACALRRHRRRRLASVSALVLAVLATGCRTAPIHEISEAPLPHLPPGATTANLDEAIWRAGRKAGWETERIRPGVLRATWRFKHHLAVVSITHDDRRFNIRYEDSRNLLHSEDQIHRNYNGLVRKLAEWIQREPVRPSARDGSE